MEPITVLSIISAGAFVYDRWKKGKEGSLERFQLPSAAGPNPQIGQAELDSFTSVQEGLRHLDRRISDGMFPTLGAARSAIPIPAGPVGPISPGARVYRIMPLQAGHPTAAEVALSAFKEGRTVLASLSIIGLGWGSSDPMLLVVGGPELHQLARAMPRGDFALLDPKVERAVVVAAPAEVVSETQAAPPAPPAPAPEPTKKSKVEHKAKANGAVANGVDAKAPADDKPAEKSEG